MFKIHFLNTIWSDSMILENNGHFAFIDTASGFYYPMVKEYAQNLNIQKIDFILLTHFHSDHYGNIKNLLNDFEVGKLYLREYTFAEAVGGSGEEATEEYNQNEKNKCEEIKVLAKEKSELVLLDGSIKEIDFQDVHLDIVNPIPYVKKLYEEETSPIYHVRRYSENNNSCAVFIYYNNHPIYLGADLTDSVSDIPELNKQASNGLKELYNKYNVDHIEVYKCAHHGGPGHNNLELLQLLNADHIVITNTNKWLDNWSTIPNIKLANPDTKIYQTDVNFHIFDFSEKETKVEIIPKTSLFIELGKN